MIRVVESTHHPALASTGSMSSALVSDSFLRVIIARDVYCLYETVNIVTSNVYSLDKIVDIANKDVYKKLLIKLE